MKVGLPPPHAHGNDGKRCTPFVETFSEFQNEEIVIYGTTSLFQNYSILNQNVWLRVWNSSPNHGGMKASTAWLHQASLCQLLLSPWPLPCRSSLWCHVLACPRSPCRVPGKSGLKEALARAVLRWGLNVILFRRAVMLQSCNGNYF